jgi:class 3 adenylate cyclase
LYLLWYAIAGGGLALSDEFVPPMARGGRSLRGQPAARRITILFADVDEPAAGEFVELGPEDVSTALSAHLDRMRAEIDRFGGTIEQAAGGTVMAAFGIPTIREDDPERAVRAALAIREALLKRVPAAGASERPSVQLRSSVVTGEAMVQTAAGETRITGDLIGEGALLQQAAPPGTVMVSEATERATAHVISYGPPSLLSLRGRAKPVTVWSALRPHFPQRRDAGTDPTI